MGGDSRYPFPKYVWSPSGGWWARPHNWRSNTLIAVTGSLAIVYAVWTSTSPKETNPVPPNRPIPWRSNTTTKSDS